MPVKGTAELKKGPQKKPKEKDAQELIESLDRDLNELAGGA